jgi:hypothetical protein
MRPSRRFFGLLDLVFSVYAGMDGNATDKGFYFSAVKV